MSKQVITMQPATTLLDCGSRSALNTRIAKVTRVRVLYPERTTDASLAVELGPLLDKVKNIDDLVTNTYLAASHLQDVGLFQNVVPLVDADPDVANGYHVLFLAKEPSPYKARITTAVDNRGETHASFSGESCNLRGTGEMFQAQMTYGLRGTTLMNINISKPLLGWQKYCNITSSIYRSFASYVNSAYSAHQTGAKLSAQLRGKNSLKNFYYTATANSEWRSVAHDEEKAPPDVRLLSGDNLKNSITQEIAYTTEDNNLLPHKGIRASIAQDIAGGKLGGNVSFTALRNTLRVSTPLPYDFILCSALRLLHLKQFDVRTSMLDRMYLGGPTDLRGFEQYLAGPSDNGVALGGASVLAGAVHLYRNLFPRNVVYLHAFLTAGNITPINHSKALANLLTDKPRTSVGLGLAVKVGNFVRLELNYCVPIIQHAGDGATPGFQFGAGVDFL